MKGRDLTRTAGNLAVIEDTEEKYDPRKFLNAQQQLFCTEYLRDFNGRQAAIRAGYSAKSAHAQSSNLLNNYNVALYIQRQLEARKERVQVTADMVLRELGWIALSDIGNYEIDEEGFVAPREGAPSEVMRAVKSIKRKVWFDENGKQHIETEITLYDKIAGLKMFAQHLGMLIEKHSHEVTGAGGGPIQHWVVAGREIHF